MKILNISSEILLSWSVGNGNDRLLLCGENDVVHLFVTGSFVIDFCHDFDDQIFDLVRGRWWTAPGNIGTYHEGWDKIS